VIAGSAATQQSRSMTRIRARGLCGGLVLLLGLSCVGCGHFPPRLMKGDAEAAQVEYEEGDLDTAKAVANRHCARYERVAFYENSAENIAYFACVHR
jgi:hypothetical protein